MPDHRSTGPQAAAAARRAKAWEYALRGWSNQRIADALAQDGLGRVTRQAVHKMLDKARREMFEEMKDKTDQHKSQQTAALMRIYEEAMAAWEASKKPQKVLTQKRAGPASTAGHTLDNATVVIRDSTGDPRHLQAALEALADIRDIWGLDAAQRHHHGGDDDVPPIRTEVKVTGQLDLSAASTEDLRSIRDLRNRLAGVPGPGSGNAAGGSSSQN